MRSPIDSSFVRDTKRGSSCNRKPKKKREKYDLPVLRKAPQAPKRFKSSYIFFFTSKQQEIKESLGGGATVGAISKKSSELWKALPPKERTYWDDVAKKDKKRYMKEKAEYSGPWQIPWTRSKKDPSAPKRAMSAFLFFCQNKRQKIKGERPGILNTELSSILGEMWRNSSGLEKKPYIEKEKREREKYKVAMAKWKVEEKERKTKEREMESQKFEYESEHSNDYRCSLNPYPYQSHPRDANNMPLSYSQPVTNTIQHPNCQQLFDGFDKCHTPQTYPTSPCGFQQLCSQDSYTYPHRCTQNVENTSQYHHDDSNLYQTDPRQVMHAQAPDNRARDPYPVVQFPEYLSPNTNSSNMTGSVMPPQDFIANKPYYNNYQPPSDDNRNYPEENNIEYAEECNSPIPHYQNGNYFY